MFFREAKSQDIEKMQAIQLSLADQQLAGIPLATPEDYRRLLADQGKGWVCEVEGDLLGFALVAQQQARVCALVVYPGLEDNFIGRMLHDLMTSWCFARGMPRLLLNTVPNTRTELFFGKAGWVRTGTAPNGEICLELENNLEPFGY
jgi:N-acetylglutamate synthase-like GNAT family acetyltransferase